MIPGRFSRIFLAGELSFVMAMSLTAPHVISAMVEDALNRAEENIDETEVIGSLLAV